jgi:hypothetical protein
MYTIAAPTIVTESIEPDSTSLIDNNKKTHAITLWAMDGTKLREWVSRDVPINLDLWTAFWTIEGISVQLVGGIIESTPALDTACRKHKRKKT